MNASRVVGLFTITPLLALVLSGCGDFGGTSLSGVGKLAPPIRAMGWLNGPAPEEAELAGNVVVLDCFASW